MRRVSIAKLGVIWLLTAPRLASADTVTDSVTVLRRTADQLVPGERVRITSLDTRLAGRFAGIEADSLLGVRTWNSDPVWLSLSRIEAVEVSDGAKRHWLAGAALGLVLGVAVGALMSAGKEDPTMEIPEIGTVRFQGLTRSAAIVTGAGIGLAGVVVVGYLVRTERWREVALAP